MHSNTYLYVVHRPTGDTLFTGRLTADKLQEMRLDHKKHRKRLKGQSVRALPSARGAFELLLQLSGNLELIPDKVGLAIGALLDFAKYQPEFLPLDDRCFNYGLHILLFGEYNSVSKIRLTMKTVLHNRVLTTEDIKAINSECSSRTPCDFAENQTGVM